MSSPGNQPPPGPQATQQWAAPEGQPTVPAAFERPAKKPGLLTRFKNRTFSNLNLNGHTPPRVQPEVGEWGPEKVPTTKQKKRMRIYVGIALPVVMLAIFLLGWYVYYMMTGCYGFGLGCRTQ
ncbi:MAG TPA: hypothetical protein VIP98_13185 [Microlunatus sp.]